ncbi:MAG: SGNH/GDSL hydrolase family protein [Marinibacterium sp.]
MSTPPDQIAYFGDSLTDNGNLLAFGTQIFDPAFAASLAGPTGAVSDGPTHAAYTAALTGLPTQNYAVASAEVAGTQTLGDLVADNGLTGQLVVPVNDPLLDTDINLAAQTDRFLADNFGTDLSNTTAFILIGGNDYNSLDFGSPTLVADAIDKLTEVVTGLATEAFRLSLAGVDDVLISSLPTASFFAGTAAFSPTETALAEIVFSIHNTVLDDVTDMLSSSGIDARFYDFRAITDAIVDDPTGFGLIAPYDQTQTGSAVLSAFDADQVAFYDSIHPSTATHGVIGAFNALALTGVNIDTGTAFSDFTDLTNAADVATGLGGGDVIQGGNGDDVIIGGTGDDVLSGQGDNDLLSGGQDNDLLRGGAGADILGGGWGDDLILGGAGADLLIGGLGSDALLGGRGQDTFIFTQADLIGGTAGTDNDIIAGGAGADTLILALNSTSFSALATDLQGATPDAALAALGLSVTGVESIIAVDGRDGLLAFSAAPWFAEADVWGLI